MAVAFNVVITVALSETTAEQEGPVFCITVDVALFLQL